MKSSHCPLTTKKMSFKFKQFELSHEQSPMKLGTDALLLGCLVNVKRDQSVLDVGTGCGVIALMIAQRNPEVSITGIDIDSNAIREAKRNFNNSPWSDRLEAQNESYQAFSQNQTAIFDHIVSNPPFFSGNKLSIYPSRTKSRHTVYLSHEAFISSSVSVTHDRSRLTVILPMEKAENFIQIAALNGFNLCERISIQPFPGKPANRVVLSFSRGNYLLQTSSLCIYEAPGIYTDNFRRLTEDFYIDLD